MSSIRNSLDEIINIDIEIGAPSSNDEGFNDILIVVSAPNTNTDLKISGVTLISEVSKLRDYGYTVNHPAYIAASVVFAQKPAPKSLYMIVRADGEEDYEPLADCLNRALEHGSWYGLALESTFSTKAEIEEAIKWTEMNKKLFGFTVTEIADIPGISSNFRSYGIYAGGVPDAEQPIENQYTALALMAKCFCYAPGSETWGLKDLEIIRPCKLSNELKKALESANISYFTSYAGKNIINSRGGKVLGDEWIDTIRFRDWLKGDMQKRVFSLIVSNPKLPYTDGGITAIQGMMEESLKAGQDVGGIASTEFDEEENEIPGYSTSVPKSRSLSGAQKKSRRLPGCKFSARLAGAIQAVDISGTLKN